MKDRDIPNTEQQILNAAEEEFFTKGFAGARTIAIAEKAGVTHAMLHYYFRTKEQLFEQVIAKNAGLLAQTVITAMGDPDMPIIERLRSGIESHFDFIMAHPQLPRFIINEVVTRPEHYHLMHAKINEIYSSIMTGLQAEVDRAAECGEIERVDVRMLFISIISLNILPSLIYTFFEPASAELIGGLMADKEQYFARRKQENIETIMRRIKKM